MVLAPAESREEPNAAIFSPAMPTSPTKVPPGVTTVPPLTIVSSFITLSFFIPSGARGDSSDPPRLFGRRVPFHDLVSTLVLVAVGPANLRLQHHPVAPDAAEILER